MTANIKKQRREKNVILLNNLFSGTYIKDKIGGEIINVYQSDNGNYYVYANPYGNIGKDRDDRIEYVLYIRSVGNRRVKIIGKAKIEEQINLNAIFSRKNNQIKELDSEQDLEQKKYIDNNDVRYGGIKLSKLCSWSPYYVTFKAESIYKAKADIYLGSDGNQLDMANTTILQNVNKINNQSQKLYIESTGGNYQKIKEIIDDKDLWEVEPVGKVPSLDEWEKDVKKKSFLSIIKKENDELVNSNLLAHFLEKNEPFWREFAKKVLKIEDIIGGTPTITRESFSNIDLLIEVKNSVIVIENKIKSRINGQKINGYSQLKKYWEAVVEDKKYKDYKKYFFILRPNYNNEDFKVYDADSRYKEIKYSEINEVLDNLDLEIESHFYFEEFKQVVKKHSSEYDNELFEVLKERFMEQINSKR